ncbi:MAG: ferrous iron transport protein B [Deltaproteobacteria bacterium]|nr:ferrous iron transport protein B [Deltaproteobacteria bacterium]MBW2044353.1 ferrous iron transport protein B [Deltaproteobacteria bacterium]MBW2298920.1 ferrous iron transport protein B [Deltaproteobacteria bacterium]
MKKIKIALSGNPNSGKSTIFNALTGARQHIANYPGVTVEKKSGWVSHKGYNIEVVDLPGTYSLTAYSLEEIVARDFLIKEKPDVVVDIVDASNLDRNLYLTVQFKELGVPLVIALNMVDVASQRGIIVNKDSLSSLLGVPVVPTVARSNQGIQDLLDKIIEVVENGYEWRRDVISYGRDIDQGLRAIEEIIRKSGSYDKIYSPWWLALKCLEGDEQVRKLIRQDEETGRQIEEICNRIYKHTMDTLEEEPEGVIADHRYGYIAGITRKAVKRKIESRLNVSDRVDRILTNRAVGPFIMLLILYLIYEFTFWGSEAPVGWFEAFFGWLKGLVSTIIPAGLLNSLIVSGIIDGVGGVVGFVPLIMFMFFAIAIMEDTGYMARIAFMLDRLLRWFGLHGNSVMALLISGGISGGCAVPGVMATRTLKDPKERIATLLVVPFMNCGAKLPLFGMLIGAFFVRSKANMMFVFTLLSWAFALFAAKVIRVTVLRGPTTPFVMELPPYRVPTLKGLLIHTWERTWQYIKKAGTIILVISIILWAMMTFPVLSKEERRKFEEKRQELKTGFLKVPGIRNIVKDSAGLDRLDELFSRYVSLKEKAGPEVEKLDKSPLLPLIKEAYKVSKKSGAAEVKAGEGAFSGIAIAYLRYREEARKINNLEQQQRLRRTIAGRIGQMLQKITRPIGFDYRVNVALLGGFAAKEVIVSTLGTAYSLGELNPEQSEVLSSRLQKDPNWSPLLAFTLIVFSMLYVPCFATVVMIKRESSWKWAGFSIVFNLVAAYVISLAVYNTGLALGVGLAR